MSLATEKVSMQATGEIETIIFRGSNGYIVLKIRLDSPLPSVNQSEFIICNGHSPFDLKPGLSVKVSGSLENTKYGEQIKFQSLEILLDDSPNGMEKFLGSGLIEGLGPVTAKKIVDHFGKEAYDILDHNPSRLSEIPRLGQATIQKISEAWNQHRTQATQYSPLLEIGLSLKQAEKAHDLFGRDALEILKENPYLMTEIPGIGFHKADKIAFKQGMKPENPDRILAGVAHCLKQSESEGHCYLPAKNLFDQLKALLQIQEDYISKELKEAKDNPAYEKFLYTEGRWYLKELRLQELEIAEVIRRMGDMRDPRFQMDFPIVSDLELSPEQEEGVRRSLKAGLSVITGLPGTGKTTMVKAILNSAKGTIQNFKLAAPTGKAAKRLQESTGFPASTLHRLLGLGKDNQLINDQPIEHVGLIVIDEFSMVDLRLAYHLFSRMNPSYTKIILVGDYRQLPSVGPGQVLRDIIQEQCCPITALKEIQRQAKGSPIVELSHAVQHGDYAIPDTAIGENDQLVLSVIREEPEELKDKILGIVEQEQRAGNTVQVLTPLKTKGVLCAEFLNSKLQPICNPEANNPMAHTIGKFIIGDRVIQTSNNYDLLVFNGEVGTITDICKEAGKESLTVNFEDRLVMYAQDEMKQLQLSYALTIHKSQGSEFDTVVLVLHTHHYIMLRRELVYTAITRAKRRLIICLNRKAYKIAVLNEETSRRFTSLFELNEKKEKREVEF